MCNKEQPYATMLHLFSIRGQPYAIMLQRQEQIWVHVGYNGKTIQHTGHHEPQRACYSINPHCIFLVS